MGVWRGALKAGGLCWALALTGCGEGDNYVSGNTPDTKVEGEVERIEVRTQKSKLRGEVSKQYVIILSNGWSAFVPESRVSETSLRFLGGERVILSCYRPDQQWKVCSHSVSLVSRGRELVQQ